MLSIIIVNYKSSGLILDCLASLYRYNRQGPYEVIVVDNDSKDNSREVVMAAYPSVIWHEMGYNAGFARANNAGMKRAKGNCYLLLNPDTLCTDNSIEQCYLRLKHSSFMAAGVQLYNEDGSTQVAGSYFVKGGLNHLLPIPYWGSFIRWLGYKTNQKVPGLEAVNPVDEVDWINGAFLMVKQEAVAQAGLMDEDFFLYGEEVEWCSRLKKVGRLCIFNELSMVHLQGEAVNKNLNTSGKGYQHLFDKKGLQIMVSNHLRVRKQYGVFWFLMLLLNYIWGFWVFLIVSFFRNLLTLSNPFREWPLALAFGKNVARLWLLAPAIIKNKPHFYKII